MSVDTRREQARDLPETLFSVPGIRCAGCIAKLETGLIDVPGIAQARVNVTAKRVRVSHAPDMTMPDLESAFARLGFEAQPMTPLVRPDDGDTKLLLRAFAVAGFAAMNIMLLSVSVWSGADGATRDMFHWLSAIIALPTVAYAGRPFFRSALQALKAGRTNMDVPISIGVILATALSLFETITHGQHAYFDGAVMLLFFLLAGRWLDSAMRDRAREGVSALLRHTAPGGLVIETDGSTRWVAATALEPGMTMLVASGERFAADGTLYEGRTHIDLSLLTGESVPVAAGPDDRVHAGTLNIGAPVRMTVTAVGEETAIADIARLMDDAAQGKSRYVRIADRAARFYAPAVHALAALSFAGWMLSGAGWHASLLIAVAVLIITCPCALGLAVPAAQIVASGALMRAGILVKDGSALERLADADRVLFDKTGTLTLERPQPVNLALLSGRQKSVALALAQSSRHPLSRALHAALEADGVLPADIADVAETAGSGVTALWQGKAVALSRPALPVADDLPACELRIEGDVPAVILFHLALRPDAAETVAALTSLGLPGAIMTGDSARATAPVARTLGLTAQTAMRPADKLDTIRRLAGAGHKVLMIGDGLNDGPALSAGHVSMAPASASDVGQNAADAVFLGDSLAPVARAVRAARATQRIVRQNFALAIGYNVIAVPLAIFGYVTPLIAAVAMSGSSVIVVANALRLRTAAR